MPSALPVTVDGMNYASVVFVAGVVFAGAWYAINGRKTYQGPPLPASDIEARRASAEYRRSSASI
jgi:hypothetical protein